MVEKSPRFWQGDPMSSYIFVIVQQLLSSLLDLNVNQNKIKPFPVKNIKILHLVFADDVLITIRATPNSCKHLSKVFRLYSSLTGLNINKGKSAVIFPQALPCWNQAQGLQHPRVHGRKLAYSLLWYFSSSQSPPHQYPNTNYRQVP